MCRLLKICKGGNTKCQGLKNGIDLKELEKYGFDDFGVGYKRYGTLGEQYFINKSTREIKRLHPYSFREEPTVDEIYDLIKADLVEKVELK